MPVLNLSDTIPRMGSPRKPLAGWLRFSIRSALFLMVLIAIPLGWKVNRVRAQRQAVARIQAAKGSVLYDFEQRSMEVNPEAPGPRWLTDLLGRDFFADVVSVCLRNGDALEALRHLPALEHVMLSSDALFDEAVPHLQKCPSLCRVEVYPSEHPRHAARGLGEALPKCWVYFAPKLEPGSLGRSLTSGDLSSP